MAILVSPDFLFGSSMTIPRRTEAHPVSQYELASRLSTFWSSMPDDDLLASADRGVLQMGVLISKSGAC